MRRARWPRAVALVAALALSLQVLAPLAGQAGAGGQWLTICADGELKQVLVPPPDGADRDGGSLHCPDCIGCAGVGLPGPEATGRPLAWTTQRSAGPALAADTARSRHAMADPGPSRAPPPHL